MQRYREKVYQRSSNIYESPLFSTIQEELQLQSSFCTISDAKQKSMEHSRGFPLTISKQKCKNCQKLQKCLTLLTNQLLNIEKNILEKEENLNIILAEKVDTIKVLQAKLENLSDKNHLNHFSSTFYTQAESKQFSMAHNFSKNNMQDNKPSISLISEKKTVKHSFVSAYNLDVIPHKIRQSRQLNQNIPPNSQKQAKDKLVNKLQFEIQALKNYNSALLSQIEKLKKSKY